MHDTARALKAIGKKERRAMRHQVRKQAATIEGVVRTVTTQLRDTPQHQINVTDLYQRASRDMGKRTDLTNRWHGGDVQAGKARRKLNDWSLATAPAGPTTAWEPTEGKRRAVGKCDSEAVLKLNMAKRG